MGFRSRLVINSLGTFFFFKEIEYTIRKVLWQTSAIKSSCLFFFFFKLVREFGSSVKVGILCIGQLQ